MKSDQVIERFASASLAEVESNDSRATASALALGGVITGNNATYSDIDYFAITVGSAGVLNLNFDRPDNSGSGDFLLTLEDAQGTIVSSSWQMSDLHAVSIGIGQAGAYYASIRNTFSAVQNSGTYSLGAAFSGGSTAGYETESNNTQAVADPLVIGSTVNGDLSQLADVDYFAVTVAAPGLLNLTLDKPGFDSYVMYQMTLENSLGVALAYDIQSVFNPSVTVGILQAGTYFVRLDHPTDSGPTRDGQYGLTATHFATSMNSYELEPNSTRATADTLVLGETVAGNLSSTTDNDYFAITVNSAGFISLNFNRPEILVGPNLINIIENGKFSIQLEDTNGTVQAGFRDTADPQVFTVGVSQAGTYYARIAAFESWRGGNFYDDTYTLTASHVPGSIAGYETESNDTRATAEAATFGSAFSGQLASGTDVDYFAYTVAAPGVLTFDFNVPDDRPTLLDDGYVTFTVEDQNGNTLASYSSPTDPQTFNVGVALSGTYFVKLTGFNDNPYSLTTTYSAGTNPALEAEVNDTRATANTIALGAATSGQLSSLTDVDYFSFEVSSTGLLGLTFDRPDATFADQFNITLENAQGVVLSRYNTSTDPQTTNFAISQAGTYYARIQSANNYGDPGGTYSLTATHAAGSTAGYETEFNNNRATATSIALGATTAGQLSAANDFDYFAITVNAAGVLTLDFDRPADNPNYTVSLEDSTGMVLGSFSYLTDPQTMNIGVTQAGTYYARVASVFAADYNDGTYAIKATHSTNLAAETESNNTRETANPVTLGTATLGQLSSTADFDYYAFTVSSAGVVSLNFDGPQLGAAGVFTIQMEDSNGLLLAAFRNVWNTPQTLNLAVAQPGTYYARISNSDSFFLLAGGEYSFAVNHSAGGLSGFESESNNSIATADVITTGVAVDGQLSSTEDLDYYKIAVSSPGALNLQFELSTYYYDGLATVNVESADGQLIASFRGMRNSTNFTVDIEDAGSYYVRIDGYNSLQWFGDQYRLTTSQTAGSAALNQIRGGQGDDEIDGNALNNVFYGLGGNDFIDGKGGRDTSVYSVSSTSARLEYDFSRQLTVHSGGADNSDALRNVEILQFTDRKVVLRDPLTDFNADANSDLLWFRQSDGYAYLWTMTNNVQSGGNALGQIGSAWTIQTTGDFNGDGSSDFIWKNTTTGQFYIWNFTNGIQSGGANLANIGTNWNVVGSGDFNADGTGDIVWRDSNTGQLYLWMMQNNASAILTNLGAIGVDWTVQAVGDFNGDGTSDLALRNTATGQAYLWNFTDGTLSGGNNLGNVPTNWTIMGSGDFNADGTNDLAWRNGSNGNLNLWMMQNNSISATSDLGTIGAQWTIDAISDVNADGTSDLLLKNTTSGQFYIWDITNGVVSGGADLGLIGADWQLV